MQSGLCQHLSCIRDKRSCKWGKAQDSSIPPDPSQRWTPPFTVIVGWSSQAPGVSCLSSRPSALLPQGWPLGCPGRSPRLPWPPSHITCALLLFACRPVVTSLLSVSGSLGSCPFRCIPTSLLEAWAQPRAAPRWGWLFPASKPLALP